MLKKINKTSPEFLLYVLSLQSSSGILSYFFGLLLTVFLLFQLIIVILLKLIISIINAGLPNLAICHFLLGHAQFYSFSSLFCLDFFTFLIFQFLSYDLAVVIYSEPLGKLPILDICNILQFIRICSVQHSLYTYRRKNHSQSSHIIHQFPVTARESLLACQKVAKLNPLTRIDRQAITENPRQAFDLKFFNIVLKSYPIWIFVLITSKGYAKAQQLNPARDPETKYYNVFAFLLQIPCSLQICLTEFQQLAQQKPLPIISLKIVTFRKESSCQHVLSIEGSCCKLRLKYTTTDANVPTQISFLFDTFVCGSKCKPEQDIKDLSDIIKKGVTNNWQYLFGLNRDSVTLAPTLSTLGLAWYSRNQGAGIIWWG